MKIYIAGKITGNEGYKEHFAREKAELEGLGHIVLNPAELPEGMTKSDYMRICFAMIDSADAVVLLSGWSESMGATVEFYYAEYVEKKIYREEIAGFKDITNSEWLKAEWVVEV